MSVRSTGIGTPFSSESEHEILSDGELGEYIRNVESRVWDEHSRGGAHRLLVARGVGAQSVLNAVAHLAEDHVGHVVRELRAEADSHALRPNDSHDLLYPLEQRGLNRPRFSEEGP